MDTVIKNIKQYSSQLNKETLDELQFIANQYKSVKNYVCSRYSGINSIPLLGRDRQIRNEWTRTKFAKQWKLPARYWKLALSEAMSNIKSQWSNIKIKVKKQVKVNNNLLNEDKHYINYVLKFDNLYHKVLTNKSFDIPNIFQDKGLKYKYLNNLIRRYTRKYKGKIPYSRVGKAFSLDEGLYSYKEGYINITCPKCGEIHSDYNASNNILSRKYDKEITLYTNYKKVKEILENRIS